MSESMEEKLYRARMELKYTNEYANMLKDGLDKIHRARRKRKEILVKIGAWLLGFGCGVIFMVIISITIGEDRAIMKGRLQVLNGEVRYERVRVPLENKPEFRWVKIPLEGGD